MIDYILDFRFNSLLGLGLYWTPFLLCAYGYIVKTARNYLEDKRRCTQSTYMPTDTVGDIVYRMFLTVCPVVNLFTAIFDVFPEVFNRFFKHLGKFLNQPMVKNKGEGK